jgi:hypothetical protein
VAAGRIEKCGQSFGAHLCTRRTEFANQGPPLAWQQAFIPEIGKRDAQQDRE